LIFDMSVKLFDKLKARNSISTRCTAFKKNWSWHLWGMKECGVALALASGMTLWCRCGSAIGLEVNKLSE